MTDPRDPRDSHGDETPQRPPVGKASVGRHEAPPVPPAADGGARGGLYGAGGAGGAVYGAGGAAARPAAPPGHYGQPAVPAQPAAPSLPPPPPGVPGALSGPHAAVARPQASATPPDPAAAPGTPHGAPLPQRPPLPPPPPLTQFANGPGGAVLGRDATLSSPAVQAAGPAPATAAPPAQTASPAQTSSGTATRAATQAAAATASRAAAVPLSEARAVPDTTPQAPPGTVYESRRPPGGGDGHRGLSGKLARLRIGSHTASRSALAQLRISSPGTGLILGADRQQGPVSVRFFRPEPTRIALVGGAWAGQLVTFRALALGARVAVVTADPQAWQGFGERATGRGDRVAVLSAEQPLAVTASAQQPILVVYDLGQLGATAPQPLGPWQTQLTILRQLSQPGVPSIQDCNLVMLQRLGSTEAALAGSSLRLPAASTQFLQVMADDMIALVGDGAERYIWFAQTDVERQYAGAPRR